MKRILTAAIAALAVAGIAHAGLPAASTELRTQIVVSQTATGTNTLTGFALAPGHKTLGTDSTSITDSKTGIARTQLTFARDSLVVIDYILYSATAGASDEVWTVSVKDDAAVAICPTVAQTVAGNAADWILVPFPTGLPLWNTTSISTVVRTRSTPCSTNYAVSVTGPTASGGLTIGYHFELPGDRKRP